MKKIVTSIFILLSIFIFTACQEVESYDILTTNFITYDVVKSVVGDELKVGVLTAVNQDYHDYEPTSKDLLKIKQTKLLVILGFEYETWLNNEEGLENFINQDAAYINLSSFIEEVHEEHEDEDHDHHHGEHFWTNPKTYLHIIDEVYFYLSEMFPELSDSFELNWDTYTTLLTDTNISFQLYLRDNPIDEIYFVGHNALQGFSEFLNIRITPLENSINPHSDPTSEDVNIFIKLLKDKNVKIVFTEEFVNESYVNFIKEAIPSIKFLELHGYHKVSLDEFNEGITYIDLLLRNIENLKEVHKYEWYNY